MPFTYPPVRRSDQTDDYHGVVVADPYRWLEDPDSSETQAFVEAQDALARSHLANLHSRSGLVRRMTELWDVPRTGVPVTESGVTVWTHNDGLANQPVFHVDAGDGEIVQLLDPNELSDDGAVAVTQWSLAPDGTTLAYTVSESGRDWQQIRFRDITTRQDLSDRLDHVKFSSLAWHNGGIFYERFPEVDQASVAVVREPFVCHHELGTAQEDDPVVFRNEADPDLSYASIVTHDQRFLVLAEWRGTSLQMGYLYRSLDGDIDDWVRLIDVGEAMYTFVGHHDGRFYFRTDRDHPHGSVVSMRLTDMTTETVVPSTEHPLADAHLAAGRLFVTHLVDASHRVSHLALDGSGATTVDLPGPGTVGTVSGSLDDPVAYFGYESFTRPPMAMVVRDGIASPFGTVHQVDTAIEVERRSAVSTDGSPVGMFLLSAPQTARPAPVELYGYGGFAIDMTPTFDPARLAFIEAGGVVAIANLRGGTEHGEAWHRQGMLGSKQQVFDDFIACAQTLISDGVTTARQLGIRGRSNGGLLTAAVTLQRPDLFGAVVSQVPVTDMLRYQHFTAGRYWTVEYGDSQDPEAFAWLMAYSPAHNVDPGVAYPPILITTGETDDRVVPMHSYKLAAALQHGAGGVSTHPYLVRIDRRAGHGLGKPTSKLIEESADVFAFLLHHLTERADGGLPDPSRIT